MFFKAMKHTYHTDVAIQYKLGILDQNIIKQIPSSTLHNWKHKDFSSLVGADYANCFEQNLQMVKDILSKKRLLNAAKALYFIHTSYTKILKSVKNRKKLFRLSKDTIVSTIDRVKGCIGLDRSLRTFGISYQQYYAWKKRVACKKSPSVLCRKLNRTQLTAKEVDVVKQYLNDPKYYFWSFKNVYYQMLRDRSAYMSATSFYK